MSELRTTDPVIANCNGANRYGIECRMRDCCSRYTAPVKGRRWFEVGPFFGQVQGTRVYFGCDYYENNGKELKENG